MDLFSLLGSCLSCGRRETIEIGGRKLTVRRPLGTGGFSIVQLVEDTRTYELFALKRVACHGSSDRRVALREVECHRLLQHPNILPCVDHKIIELNGGEAIGGGPTCEVLILLPYIERGTLAYELERRQQQGSRLSESLVLNMFKQIAEAVSYMHHASPQPLAHRDLKPHNVLLAHDFSPIIMDLGSVAPAKVQVCGSSDACRLQDEAAERSSMPYRAPELFNVESYCTVDERTDIWSLGCLLHAMCFYKSPYDAVYERGDSVALAVISGNLDMPEDAPYSQGLLELIQSMLKVNPSERPFIDNVLESVAELQAKLDSRV